MRAKARRRLGLATLSAFLLALAACQRAPSREPAHRLRKNDGEMRAAEQRGQRELGRFLASFAQPQPGDSDWRFRARFSLDQGEDAPPEDLWFRLEKLEGDQLIGRLVNRPQRVKQLLQHQRCCVSKQQVNDWSFVRAGYLEGAFTLRVIYSRMNEAERRAYTRAQPRPFAPLQR
ncbi:MAG: hypothetical protein CSA62_01350 [Planctomycetota bacterium]|nr:MAG: hypothetical protein CSA62_01350 [Planctomycetota bacterium]